MKSIIWLINSAKYLILKIYQNEYHNINAFILHNEFYGCGERHSGRESTLFIKLGQSNG